MADDPRELLAEAHLLGLIAEAHDPSVRGTDDLGRFDGALAAAVAVGLVPEEERAHWAGWYDRFGSPPDTPELEPERIERALALLDELARAIADAPGEHEELHAHIRFEDATAALAAVGALSQDESDWWERRIYGGPTTVDLGPPAAIGGDDDPAPVLLRLRAAYAGWLAPLGPFGTRVIAVEVYDDGVNVRWERAWDPADDDDEDWDPAIQVWDDTGNELRPAGGGSGMSEVAGRHVATGTAQFEGVLAPEARRLSVAADGGRLELDLDGLAERPAV